MSRAVNLSLPEAKVRAMCDKAGISVSVIEALPSGGTRLVCNTGEGADEVRLTLKNHVIPGTVKRYPFFRSRAT
ncbi:RRM domain-containing protein [Novosphingobium lubricantis]|jgi:hypothetical protein